ncbi:ATP-binding protein [Streptomyces sp. NBC_01006]|uniref:ATP-binding protein n=1 Tax=Streptomyces sp. NBC_01006 TaxID=2903716 RepID=UPI00386EEFD8|nr:ATP-binding protein [Streptomyces sp. NBC_01006]
MNLDIQPALLRQQFYLRSPRTISAARGFTRDTLHAWGVTSREDDMLLCVSELATNALLHGAPPGRGYLLRLLRLEHLVRVEVHDSGDGAPIPQPQDRDGGGLGLLIVEAVADLWGVSERRPGKVVWCEFRTHLADMHSWGRRAHVPGSDDDELRPARHGGDRVGRDGR